MHEIIPLLLQAAENAALGMPTGSPSNASTIKQYLVAED
jgi:hypothetical protein